MFFNSIDFAVFLAIVLVGYYILEHRIQNVWLLVASYIFYGWWDWRFLSLIFISTVVDYFCGIKIQTAISERKRKLLLIISLMTNLGILGFFKYFNFFAESATVLFEQMHLRMDVPTLRVILPVGISFYTFQTMAYTIDVYRRRITPVYNYIDFSLYVAFFPQLVAGPIERAQNLLPQIMKKRSVSVTKFSEGVLLILVGLFRKVVIADVAARFVVRCFDFPEQYSTLGLYIGVVLFALQIYSDFAGYTDIARGVSKLLGFELMENFQQPYFSMNITEFWHRWHISFSTWLRDYLYFPLGGNRHGTLKMYRNLMLTMLLGGLWHGASWTFVVWGGLHGVYLVLHKWLMLRRKSKDQTITQKVPWPIYIGKVFVTFNLVCLTWIFFRASSFNNAFSYLAGIISFDGPWIDIGNPGKILEPMTTLIFLLLAIFLIDIPQSSSRCHTIALRWNRVPRGVFLAFLILGLMLFGGPNEISFIYFQF